MKYKDVLRNSLYLDEELQDYFNERRCGQFLGPKGTRRRKTWHIRNKKKNELSPYMMN